MTFEHLEHAALVVIDVQNDFCPGGALEVPDGDAVVAVINAIAPRFPARILTQDWHPPGHLSFASSHEGKAPFETTALPYGEQVLWPDHCVQGTAGASFHRDLSTDGADLVLRKGFRRGIDSYSRSTKTTAAPRPASPATCATGDLAPVLRRPRHRLLCRLVRDRRRPGRFRERGREDACRGIDLEGSLDAAWARMAEAGVARIRSPQP